MKRVAGDYDDRPMHDDPMSICCPWWIAPLRAADYDIARLQPDVATKVRESLRSRRIFLGAGPAL